MTNKQFTILLSSAGVILIVLILIYNVVTKTKKEDTSSPDTTTTPTETVSQGSYEFKSMDELKSNFITPLKYENILIDYRPASDRFVVLYHDDYDTAFNIVKKFFQESGFPNISDLKFDYISLDAAPPPGKTESIE